ncbi:MFS transporter, UMF1 family [Limimonas halophila]|uniref:MFS transporter, UMF1 family n=1 Tax=Limimonas halophila TaxID=1082479 RepID=A0A1G7SIJ7_9PROT|nr:MFS transporter [Limimonas halophila]SDG22906.1 MFS transporter, UMF1 family [Limimonas halophila]
MVRGRPSEMNRVAIAAWCLFDWASSAWPTVVMSFVFAAYVTREVAPNSDVGTAWWGTGTAVAGVVIALVSPVVGAIADRAGPRKPWVAGFLVVTVAMAAALFTIRPEPGYLLQAVILAGIGGAAFEIGQVFYNAMLADVAPRHMLGRVSGWAWATGYAGGLACLGTCLGLLVLPAQPLLPLDPETAEPVRATGIVVAVWFAVFALPFLLLTPDRPARDQPFGRTAREGVAQLRRSLADLRRRYRRIAHFLIARMIYTDGLNTLFAFGGVYAAGTFDMGFRDILMFGIAMNVAAGIGAFGFAWVDDWLGSKRTIVISLFGLMLFGGAALLVRTPTGLYVAGCALGTFVGPVQAASRSLMSRITPDAVRTEMFGLYAMSGKITAFAGPAVVGWVTYLAGSQRAGMATLLGFFLVGLALLWPLKPAVDMGEPKPA